MMTNKQLLESAAKAAGYILKSWCPETDESKEFFIAQLPVNGHEAEYPEYWSEEYWNPLEDDGDAFRLAAKVGLLIDLGPISCSVHKGDVRDLGFEWYNDDRCAATRRAIVCAVAKLVEVVDNSV